MAHHSSVSILAVDSASAWIAKVRTATTDQAEWIMIKTIDRGELGYWDHPTTYRLCHRVSRLRTLPLAARCTETGSDDRRPLLGPLLPELPAGG